MTRENFDKAIEINSEINNIYALQDALGNSKNGRFLAAIEAKRFDATATGIAIEDCKVLNYVRVPQYVMEKFEKILWDELERLNKEFKEL